MVIAKFEAYCEPEKNITVSKYLFNSRQQKDKESFTDYHHYLTALHTLVKDCALTADLSDEFLPDRI